VRKKSSQHRKKKSKTPGLVASHGRLNAVVSLKPGRIVDLHVGSIVVDDGALVGNKA
jgi:hypothetical protein